MRDAQQDPRKREFRRFVRWSAGAHVAALGIVMISPGFHSRPDASQVIAVDLVSLPASALAPSVAPAPPPPPAAKPVPPAEQPPPPPEPPKPKEVVLPKNPEREPSKPKPAPKPQEAPPKPEKDLDDLLADMRKDAGETTPAPKPVEEAVAPSTTVGSPATVAVTPEELAWIRKAKVHVQNVRVVPPGFKRESLETHVRVELDASGNVVGDPEITQRSGNPWYDEEVVRDLKRASPLPPPPSPRTWNFVFLPDEAR